MLKGANFGHSLSPILGDQIEVKMPTCRPRSVKKCVTLLCIILTKV